MIVIIELLIITTVYWVPRRIDLLMAMPFGFFKFKKNNAPTRIAEFDAQPSWGDLASKIAQLFNIPLKDIGVAYFDKAKDAVTITNEQELQRFYKSPKLDQFVEDLQEIKFVMQDLQTPDGESAFSRFFLAIPLVLASSLLSRTRPRHMITFIT